MKIHLTALLLLAALVSGCSSPTTPTPPPSARSPSDPFRSLKEGMAIAEVRALLGEPADIRSLPPQVDALPAEIWIYHRVAAENEKQVPIGTRELPLMNPITGQMGTTLEPIYETQKLAVKETIELLIVNQRFVTGKVIAESESQIRPN